jgi:hypothetical protein
VNRPSCVACTTVVTVMNDGSEKPVHIRSVEKYLPRSSKTVHAPVPQCRRVSFHRRHWQAHCRRRSPEARLCQPGCRPTLGKVETGVEAFTVIDETMYFIFSFDRSHPNHTYHYRNPSPYSPSRYGSAFSSVSPSASFAWPCPGHSPPPPYTGHYDESSKGSNLAVHVFFSADSE